jgi:sialate O-acetylesterase
VPALKAESDNLQLANPKSEAHQQRLHQALSGLDEWHQAARSALQNGQAMPPLPNAPSELSGPQDLQQATALYNGMIHPIVPYAIRGAIWYQGESNLGDGMRYADRMKALIAGWRDVWKQGDFPFYYMQIAPFNYADRHPHTAPEIWEAQASAAQAIPHTGMAVINDVGDLNDIHPQDKRTVGHRLALLALANTYGKKNSLFLGLFSNQSASRATNYKLPLITPTADLSPAMAKHQIGLKSLMPKRATSSKPMHNSVATTSYFPRPP